MLDDNDIKKLKDVFATKEYIDSRFDGLKENFATKTEIEHLIDIVATKDDIKDLKKDISEIAKTLGLTKNWLKQIR